MNKREHFYPVIGNILLLVAVWLLSWIVDIAATFMDTDSGLASLVSSEGIRWAIRNAMPSFNNIPWGSIMLLITAYGLLQGAGIIRFFAHITKRQPLTRMEIRSFLFSISALILYAVALYVATMTRWNILLGVTGTLENSSFISGLPLLLFFGVLVASLVYGFLYGNYRSAIDVASSLGNSFTQFVPALIALLPASAVVASIGYTGVSFLLGLSGEETMAITTVYYAIPFMHIVLEKGNSNR